MGLSQLYDSTVCLLACTPSQRTTRPGEVFTLAEPADLPGMTRRAPRVATPPFYLPLKRWIVRHALSHS